MSVTVVMTKNTYDMTHMKYSTLINRKYVNNSIQRITYKCCGACQVKWLSQCKFTI